MKKLMFIALLALAACSSKGKQPDQSATAAPSQTVSHTETHTEIPVQKPSESGNLSCVKGSETRTIAIASKDKGCVVNYTKSGSTNAVASAVSGTKHCEETQSKIVKHLEGAGYKCQ